MDIKSAFHEDGKHMIIVVYVDDLIITSGHYEKIVVTKKALK